MLEGFGVDVKIDLKTVGRNFQEQVSLGLVGCFLVFWVLTTFSLVLLIVVAFELFLLASTSILVVFIEVVYFFLLNAFSFVTLNTLK